MGGTPRCADRPAVQLGDRAPAPRARSAARTRPPAASIACDAPRRTGRARRDPCRGSAASASVSSPTAAASDPSASSASTAAWTPAPEQGVDRRATRRSEHRPEPRARQRVQLQAEPHRPGRALADDRARRSGRAPRTRPAHASRPAGPSARTGPPEHHLQQPATVGSSTSRAGRLVAHHPGVLDEVGDRVRSRTAGSCACAMGMASIIAPGRAITSRASTRRTAG